MASSEGDADQDRGRRAAGRRRPRSAPKSVAFVLRAYRTEYAIYGTVLVSALIAVGWKYETNLDVLLFVLGTVAVFWIAHIYSGVVAGEQSADPDIRLIARSVLDAARHSIGMVFATLIPALFLLLATVGLLEEYTAYYLALWAGVATLAALGYANAARRGRSWPFRLLNALVTAVLGLLVIWLSSLVHH